MQHQRDRHGRSQIGDQLEVQSHPPLGHGVRGPDGDSQRVDPGGLDERDRLVGPGPRARGVHAVLAADLAQARPRHRRRPSWQSSGDRRGGRDVFRVGSRGAVEHHRAEAQSNRLVDQRLLGGVVQVHDRGNRGAAGDRQRGQSDRCQCPVIADGVLGDLQHHGARALGARDQRLGVLDAEDVERAQPDAAAGTSKSLSRARVINAPSFQLLSIALLKKKKIKRKVQLNRGSVSALYVSGTRKGGGPRNE